MNAYIIDAVRTPRGRGNDKSALKDLRPVDLGRVVFNAIRDRNSIDTSEVEDALIGCVTQQAEQGSGIARLIALHARWSEAMSAVTINRACASGLTAVNMAAAQVAQTNGLAVGGGIEMMCRVPMGSDHGPMFTDRALQADIPLLPLGISADAVATQYGFSREACDDYAASSQQRAGRAREQGWFSSLVPVHAADGAVLLAQDETIRPDTTAGRLASIAPAFTAMGEKGLDAVACRELGLSAIRHVHHAGNSPALADGASLVLLASDNATKRLQLKPRARIVATAEAGSSPVQGLAGAVDVTRKVLRRAGLGVDDIDLFEVNEGFAALMLQYMQELGVDHERLNVNGGAIALGHAMGSTGSALLGTLLDEMERRQVQYGVVAVSGAAGVASASVIERMV